MPNAQLNNFNMNSQLNLSKKSSQPNATTQSTMNTVVGPMGGVKHQNTFSYGHQSS